MAQLHGKDAKNAIIDAQVQKQKDEIEQGAKRAGVAETTNNHVKAVKVLAVMRGRVMQEKIRAIRVQKEKDDTKHEVLKVALMSFQSTGLQTYWDAWGFAIQQIKQEKEETKAATALEASDGGLPSAEWRTREEFRRRKRRWMVLLASGDSFVGFCFSAWGQLAQGTGGRTTGTPPGTPTCSPPNSPGKPSTNSPAPAPSSSQGDGQREVVVGAHLCQKTTDSGKLIESIRTLESLYETRVAAAERLIAGYVLLHRAVKPLSKLWWLSYDMDRSESRLRVASTPAPVPFVETLPTPISEVPEKSDAPSPKEGWSPREGEDVPKAGTEKAVSDWDEDDEDEELREAVLTATLG
jgi:hypothetical protein